MTPNRDAILNSLESGLLKLVAQAGGPARMLEAFGPPVAYNTGRGVRVGVLSHRGEEGPLPVQGGMLLVSLVSHEINAADTVSPVPLVSLDVQLVESVGTDGRASTAKPVSRCGKIQPSILEAATAALESARTHPWHEPAAVKALEHAVAVLARPLNQPQPQHQAHAHAEPPRQQPAAAPAAPAAATTPFDDGDPW